MNSEASFQNEIPPARVNIKLDIDKGGAQKKVELPFKMLVLGDFSNREAGGRLADKEKINVHKENFDQVMASMDLGLKMDVEDKLNPEGGELEVRLRFKDTASFEPIEIAKQVPRLSKLLAARNLLKDLKSNLMDNKEFRRKLESIMQDRTAMDGLVAELDKFVPMDGNK